MSTRTSAEPSGSVLKRIVVGRAFSSSQLEHTLLPKVLALPVFASDALSSVAYATGEIFIQLAIVSTVFKGYVLPISVAIATLMAIEIGKTYDLPFALAASSTIMISSVA